jgi:GTP-dependent phosphoenolpyruvate carboxykinase
MTEALYGTARSLTIFLVQQGSEWGEGVRVTATTLLAL